MVKCFIALAHGGKRKYGGNLPWYFNHRNIRVKIVVVNYHGIFITLAPGEKKKFHLLHKKVCRSNVVRTAVVAPMSRSMMVVS